MFRQMGPKLGSTWQRVAIGVVIRVEKLIRRICCAKWKFTKMVDPLFELSFPFGDRFLI